MVLCELERETGKSISQCFNLLAGTSTGEIISLGLSVPDEQDTRKPKYKATNIYTEHSKDIFGKKSLFSDFSAYTSSR